MPGAACLRNERNARRSSSSSTNWMTLVRRFSFPARATSPASFVDTVLSASGAAVYPSSSKLSCSASSLRGHCPASSVLQADPRPLEPWRSLGALALLPLLIVLRAPWVSPVPPSITFPACRALRPRQSLQRGRHNPRLLVPSRTETRSASARSVLVGVGMVIAGHPRLGSRRAELRHRALVLGQNAKRSWLMGRAGW